MQRPLDLTMDLSKFVSPTWVGARWDRLRTSFWFLPSLFALGAVVLSFSLVQADTES